MNYKIRADAVKDIRDHVRELLQRRVDYALGACPLDLDDVRQGLMTPEQHELTKKLQGTGFNQFRSTNSVAMYVSRDQFPGIKREAVIHLGLPEYVLQPRAVFMAFRDERNIQNADQDDINNLYKLLLPDAKRQEVATWVTRVIRETRMQDMINWCAGYVLRECKTTGEVLALWPQLGTYPRTSDWKNKFRDAPRKLRNYAPKRELVEKVSREIEVADPWLQGAQMLEPWERKPKTVQANLVAWQWLDNDRVYEPIPS